MRVGISAFRRLLLYNKLDNNTKLNDNRAIVGLLRHKGVIYIQNRFFLHGAYVGTIVKRSFFHGNIMETSTNYIT